MMPEICPRCREPVKAGATFVEMPTAPGRLAAWRLRHKRAGGAGCVAYVGPELARAAPSVPSPTALAFGGGVYSEFDSDSPYGRPVTRR
jgi:hypothetical protein